MTAFFVSLFFILLAEIGDKTQLLAMGFASKYKAYKVLLGVFIATIINNSLAVILGKFLSTVIPFKIISFCAALSFILFGLWILHGEKLGDEAKKESKLGPIFTVALAFFIAEMGDKTQLAVISMTIKYSNPIYVLLGSTAGMVIADSIGIIAGVILAKNIPQKTIKWVSAGIFILFGLAGVLKFFI